jgi:hypothetical protein
VEIGVRGGYAVLDLHQQKSMVSLAAAESIVVWSRQDYFEQLLG